MTKKSGSATVNMSLVECAYDNFLPLITLLLTEIWNMDKFCFHCELVKFSENKSELTDNNTVSPVVPNN